MKVYVSKKELDKMMEIAFTLTDEKVVLEKVNNLTKIGEDEYVFEFGNFDDVLDLYGDLISVIKGQVFSFMASLTLIKKRAEDVFNKKEEEYKKMMAEKEAAENKESKQEVEEESK